MASFSNQAAVPALAQPIEEAREFTEATSEDTLITEQPIQTVTDIAPEPSTPAIAAKTRNTLQSQYPWTTSPFICSAPMRLISGPALTHSISSSRGLGFLGAGVVGKDTTITAIQSRIRETHALFSQTTHSPAPTHPTSTSTSPSPFGIGFLIVGTPSEHDAIAALTGPDMPPPPAAVWLFPASSPSTLRTWTTSFRTHVSPAPKIWIQIGCVAQALEIARLCAPDVLVVQGADAGGHGMADSASLMTLLPEVADALRAAGFDIPLVAAGGVADGRGVAAAVMLGADGVAMGTRFLGAQEADITEGYRRAVLDAEDGGKSTVRTGIYDRLRGTVAWPEGYNGRGVKNRSWEEREAIGEAENKEMYAKAMATGDAAWGIEGRATTYAGTAVGLVTKIRPAREIVEEVRNEATRLLGGGGLR